LKYCFLSLYSLSLSLSLYTYFFFLPDFISCIFLLTRFMPTFLIKILQLFSFVNVLVFLLLLIVDVYVI
jgi:hypothetical protein